LGLARQLLNKLLQLRQQHLDFRVGILWAAGIAFAARAEAVQTRRTSRQATAAQAAEATAQAAEAAPGQGAQRTGLPQAVHTECTWKTL
jgi:hypothetical protein